MSKTTEEALARVLGSAVIAAIGYVIVSVAGAPIWGAVAVCWLTYLIGVNTAHSVRNNYKRSTRI